MSLSARNSRQLLDMSAPDCGEEELDPVVINSTVRISYGLAQARWAEFAKPCEGFGAYDRHNVNNGLRVRAPLDEAHNRSAAFACLTICAQNAQFL